MFTIKCRNIIPQCSVFHLYKKLCDLDSVYEWEVVKFPVWLLSTAIRTKGLKRFIVIFSRIYKNLSTIFCRELSEEVQTRSLGTYISDFAISRAYFAVKSDT